MENKTRKETKFYLVLVNGVSVLITQSLWEANKYVLSILKKNGKNDKLPSIAINVI